MKKKNRFWIYPLILLVFVFASSCKKQDEVIIKNNPDITWANPSDINSGTALGATQLNATANVAGTFVYTPAIGTILSIGTNQNLRVDFTPTDAATYNTASKTVKINVASPLAIGDSYQGGKIAYIFQIGDPGYITGQTHGLIAAVSDQGTHNAWYNGTFIATGARDTALGAGSANTTTIINIQGNTGTYDAKICRDYNGGGYTDWYLPSQNELRLLYLQRSFIGGFSLEYYYSSTEVNDSMAVGLYFLNGDQFPHRKDGATHSHARAIRTF